MQGLEDALARIHPNTLLGALVYLALVLALGVAGTIAIRHAARRALKRDQIDQMAVTFIRPIAVAVLWVALGVAYLHLIPVLRAVGTAMLAGASVASIVLGVAAQNTLGNAIAGLALLVYRPFRVGDRLQVTGPNGPETGIVESVTVGYTVLRTFDNRRVVLPNSLAGTQTSVNLTSVDPKVMAAIDVGIGYTSDVGRARDILLAIAKEHRDVLDVVDCPLVELGSSSVTLRLRAWCHDQLAVVRLQHDLLERAKARFAESGIEIPYPYQNVVLVGGA
jgi:small conductance mechanosensitive channel